MHLQPGKHNSITDVHDVHTGHVTLYENVNETDTICTGVTAILPHAGDLFTEKVPAASHVINGYGKTCGLIQVDELGTIEAPIMLTNTLSVGSVLQGTVSYMLQQNPAIGDGAGSLNIVVGECNDSHLNSIRMQAVQAEHAIEAIDNASTAPVEEGAVGAGKGMVCFGYKGGIGSASRLVGETPSYTVGVLVLSNFGKPEEALFADWGKADEESPLSDGSIMIIIATDAPLYDRQLKRLAKRSAAGLGRVGSHYSNGSGDIAIAFSTANTHNKNDDAIGTHQYIRDGHPLMDQLFQAVTESTEDAILSSLEKAETTVGRKDRVIRKAPLDRQSGPRGEQKR